MDRHGELNEISVAIGQLQADSATAKLQHERTLRKLEEIGESIAKLANLADDVAEMKPAVEDWTRTKQRGLGIIAGAGIAGAGASQGLPWLLKKLGLL